MRASLLIIAVACVGCTGTLTGTVPSSHAADGGASARDAGPRRDGGAGGGGEDDGGCSDCVDDDAGGGPGRDAAVPGRDAGTRPDASVTPTCGTAGDVAPLAFTAIAGSAPDIIAPGRGAEAWHGRSDVDVPTEGAADMPLDDYHRLRWTQLERSEGVYDWTRLDALLHNAISRRQKLSFGIMSSCPGCESDALISVDGALASYPADLHRQMQTESERDWISDGYWAPNWNSPSYLSRYAAFLRAVNAHLESGSHMGVRYADAIGTIDVRGYGSWGEWHVAGIADTVDDQPPGRATAATLNRIVDMHVEAFPTQQLVLMIALFDSGRFGNMGAPIEVARHALSLRTERGPLGWRRDNWGALDDYIRALLDRHSDAAVRDQIMERWRTSPIVGEPPYFDVSYGGCPYSDLEAQVLRYHATSFGNGNYGGAESQSCMRNNVRSAARAAGYRIVLEGGSAAPVAYGGARFPITLRWHNVGLTPTYETWEVAYELRDASGAVAWSAVSSFAPRHFLPETDGTDVTDEVVLPTTLAPGSYDLVVVVRDPIGYRDPLPLAITGRRADGSYLLRSVEVLACP